MSRVCALYVWYGWTVALLLLLYGVEVPGRWWLVAAHVGVALPVWLLSRLRDSLWEALAGVVLVPMAFVGLGFVLPNLVPEVLTWHVERLDAALGGLAAIDLAKSPPVWLVESTQIAYTSFYFLPLLLGFVLYRRRRWGEFAKATEWIVGAFFLSYLGYFLFPTLPPYRFVDYGGELVGGPFQRFLWQLLHELEPIREDCMPSGHTLITLVVVLAALRFARDQLLWLVPTAALLILGTVVLRLHWLIDVFAALPFLLLTVWLTRPARSENPVLSMPETDVVERANKRAAN